MEAELEVQRRVELETAFYEGFDGGIGRLTINRPRAANSVTVQLCGDLRELLSAAASDESLHVLILTGAGDHFCAGADRKAMERWLEEGGMAAHGHPFNVRELHPATLALYHLPVPVIAAVNGSATAGGFDLALACDLRVASERARLGETYIRLGIPPANGGPFFLPRLVGPARAAEIALTGRLMDAEECLRLGLVNRVVPHESLQSHCLQLAGSMAMHTRQALVATKAALRLGATAPLEQTLSHAYASVGLAQHTKEFEARARQPVGRRKED